MEYNIFSEMVTGYKNILKKSKSQDYLDFDFFDKGIVFAVSDGHSSDFFKYSDRGAKIACNIAVGMLKDLAYLDEKDLINMLEEKKIQREIQSKWMDLVREDFEKSHPLVFKTEYIKYSTTLIAVLVTNRFRLYLKIGDGNIIIKDNTGFREILETRKSDTVDSLGRIDSFKNIMYYVDNENNKYKENIIIFTDGYEQSFVDENELYKSLDDTIYMYNKSVFSREILKRTYKQQLSKLSKQKSQDDISIVFLI